MQHDKINKFEKIVETDIEKEIDRIISANTITPAEVKNLKDAIKLMLETKEYERWENGEAEDFPDDRSMYSSRRGRSATTGRYVSRSYGPVMNEEPGYSRRSYNIPYHSRGYSGHSIKDRMISNLEMMYDDAQTEHERQMLDEWITKIEMEK